MKCGDPVTRTTSSGSTETVTLPPIDMQHISCVRADPRGSVGGFHVFPSGITAPSTRTPLSVPAGSVKVVDASGTPIVGATVRITTRKPPASVYDTLEAKVEILDSSGTVLATSSQKTFFPQHWRSDQIEKAIYEAYAEAFRAARGPVGRLVGTTSQGVKLELAVSGSTSASGTTLKLIATSHPAPAQTLDVSHQP